MEVIDIECPVVLRANERARLEVARYAISGMTWTGHT